MVLTGDGDEGDVQKGVAPFRYLRRVIWDVE